MVIQVVNAMIASNQDYSRESSAQAKCCSGKSSNHQGEVTSAPANVQDESFSGSDMFGRKDAEDTCERECSLGEAEKASVDTWKDVCCSPNRQTLEELCVSACGPTRDEPEVEEKFQNSCCSNDDEKAIHNDEHDACCSSETRKSDGLDRDDRCSGSVKDTHKEGNDSGCCRYKPGPCCDGKKRMLYPIVSCFDCSQFRALTALRFESAETIAATRLLVIDLKPTVRLV